MYNLLGSIWVTYHNQRVCNFKSFVNICIRCWTHNSNEDSYISNIYAIFPCRILQSQIRQKMILKNLKICRVESFGVSEFCRIWTVLTVGIFFQKDPKNIILWILIKIWKKIKATTLFFVTKMKKNAISNGKIELLNNSEKTWCSRVNSKS